MVETTTISVRRRDKVVFEEAMDAVAEEIGDRPTQSDALREMAEAYVGRDGLGEWQEGEQE